MANTPPIVGINLIGGYPVFSGKDTGGNAVTPSGHYLWNPLSGTNGLWLPAPVDANGNPIHSNAANRTTSLLTSTVLAANGTYNNAGGWQDANALGVNYISASVYTNQSGTLYVDLADDQNNPMLGVQSLAVIGATPVRLAYPQQITTRYFRIRYVNGATVQTTFELFQTTLAMLSPRDVNASLVGSNATFSWETTASTTEATDTANVKQWFTFANDDASNNIQINFDAAVGQPGTMTIKPGEVLNGMPRAFTTLHVKAVSGTPAFRAWGV